MVMRKNLLGFIAGFIACSGVAVAHHSFSATYYVDKEVKLEGELVAFMYRNPHSWVHLETTGADGKPVRWSVEWGAASALDKQGITRASFKPGDRVVIWGNPGRNDGDHRVRMRRILRPADGTRWGFEKGQDFQ
jgi:hypothetical protein